jgi:hypothetical protein
MIKFNMFSMIEEGLEGGEGIGNWKLKDVNGSI